jgi:hypothetical protein
MANRSPKKSPKTPQKEAEPVTAKTGLVPGCLKDAGTPLLGLNPEEPKFVVLERGGDAAATRIRLSLSKITAPEG